MLHFLVHTGYLTYQANPETEEYEVFIPNKELQLNWRKEVIPMLQVFMKDSFEHQFINSLRKSLMEFDYDGIRKIMEKMITFCSFYDLSKSKKPSGNAYHLFFYGSFLTALHERDRIEVRSNLEAGFGRFDIRIKFQNSDPKRAVVFEFKKSDRKNKLENDAKSALEQCLKKNYTADLENYECLLIGVSFYRKEISSLHTHIIDIVEDNEPSSRKKMESTPSSYFFKNLIIRFSQTFYSLKFPLPSTAMPTRISIGTLLNSMYFASINNHCRLKNSVD